MMIAWMATLFLTISYFTPSAHATVKPLPLDQHNIFLLGERHDHPQHHENQAVWLEQIAKQNNTIVVMEMMQTHQRLEPHQRPSTAEQWEMLLNWEESGWPNFDIYRPLFDVITKYQLDVLPGTLHTPQRNMKDRLEVLRKEVFRVLSIPDDIKQQMGQEMIDAHCGLLPPQYISPMVEIQWLKDAFMSQQIISALNKAPQVVLIAGNGHTQSRSGVPVHLRAAGYQVLSVVQEEPDKASYASKENYVVRTEPFPMDDPCVSLRTRFSA